MRKTRCATQSPRVPDVSQTPAESARQAVENDVHVIGVSSLAAGHLTLVPALQKALSEEGRPDIEIVVGGVVPPQDIQTLLDLGVAAVFGPGSVISDAANTILDRIGEPAESTSAEESDSL